MFFNYLYASESHARSAKKKKKKHNIKVGDFKSK
jgi:hypothetical protein